MREKGMDSSVPRCDVDFEVEMTVSSGAIAQVLDTILEEVAKKQVEAFDKRCQIIPFPAELLEAEAGVHSTCSARRPVPFGHAADRFGRFQSHPRGSNGLYATGPKTSTLYFMP